MIRASLVILLLAGCATQTDRDEPVDPRGASLLGQAQAAYGRGSLVEAIALVDSAAQYVPELPMMHFMRGLLLGEFYRFDESREAFGKTLALDPEYRGVHFNLGNSYFLQSSFLLEDSLRVALLHYQAERDLLSRFLRKKSAKEGDREALAAVMLQIGQTYVHLNVPDSAEWAFWEALRVDSSNARAYAWIADLQRNEGFTGDALKNARQAVALEPDNTEYKTTLGTLLVEEGGYEAAVAPLSEVAEKEPWNRAAVYNLGRALVKLGRTEEGARYLSRADTLETLRSQVKLAQMQVLQKPDDPIRWENYALLLHQSGRGAEAHKAINAVRYLSSEAR